mmetsp:Transcript_3750/g.9916  ORF Transcript_3750/g.9916 Transcript_3750/m.9916 type:complete len:141 (-) Transcript_3750:964-1386(-)
MELIKKKENAIRHDDLSAAPNDGILDGIVEVQELTYHEVLDGIENVAIRITQQVLSKQGFTMSVPSRTATNQIYVKEWDRIVLGRQTIHAHLHQRQGIAQVGHHAARHAAAAPGVAQEHPHHEARSLLHWRQALCGSDGV